MKITIHAGHVAWLTPSTSNPPPNFEEAGLLYTASFKEVLTNKGQQWGTNYHARSWDSIRFPKEPAKSGDTVVYFSPWNKTEMNARWRPSTPKLLPDYDGLTDTWLIGSEDLYPPDNGNFRDFMLQVICR